MFHILFFPNFYAKHCTNDRNKNINKKGEYILNDNDNEIAIDNENNDNMICLNEQILTFDLTATIQYFEVNQKYQSFFNQININ